MQRFPIHEFKRPDPYVLADVPPCWQVEDAPETLYVQGGPSREEALDLLARLPRSGLSVVGTREPQARSRQLVRQVIGELKGLPLVIVSGFARGIDAEAHLAALEQGLPTVAVLGTGLDVNYPSEHGALRGRILASGGLLLTEFAPGTAVFPGNFPKRNRLIAGLGLATWVVEAGFKSGALSTAARARGQERQCFATPSFPGDPAFQGNQMLMDGDTKAAPLWSARSLSSCWPELNTPARVRRKRFQAMNDPGFTRTDEEALAFHVGAVAAERGAVSVQECLDWAMRLDWAPHRFFLALQNSLKLRLLEDREGLLCSGPAGHQLPFAL